MNVSNIFVPQWYTAEVAEQCVSENLISQKYMCTCSFCGGNLDKT